MPQVAETVIPGKKVNAGEIPAVNRDYVRSLTGTIQKGPTKAGSSIQFPSAGPSSARTTSSARFSAGMCRSRSATARAREVAS